MSLITALEPDGDVVANVGDPYQNYLMTFQIGEEVFEVGACKDKKEFYVFSGRLTDSAGIAYQKLHEGVGKKWRRQLADELEREGKRKLRR